jgi:Xaa-Pro aminopeptidase
MKKDINRLMEERKIDVAIVEGPDGMDSANPAFAYMTGGQHLVGSVIIKRGEKPIVLFRSMERDAAAATGHEAINMDRWPTHEIIQKFPNPLDARVELYKKIINDLKLKGRVAFYGTGSIGSHFAFLKGLQPGLNGSEIIGEYDRDIFQVARETKDPDEIAKLEKHGKETCAVIGEAVEFIRSHKVKNETLVTKDGSLLTIGKAKEFIRLESARRGLVLGEDFIFALGRDGATGHSVGNPDDPIQLGKSIVFDFFPRDANGYFHDVTRTFCFGHAPKEIEKIYQQVMDCFQTVVKQFKVGETTQKYQHMTCDIFEKLGHTTQRSDPKSQNGYFHSLGHGLGLEVHEQPYFSTFGPPRSTLQPGMVFTVEPGLYYPEKGYGVRIEDTYYCDAKGHFHSITPFSQDLVIPMKG